MWVRLPPRAPFFLLETKLLIATTALHYFNSEGPERDGFAQVLQSLGAENYVYRSQAEKLAEQLASNRAPSGPVDSVQLAKHLQKLRAEDELRQGQQPNLLLFDPNDRREITRNARLTALQAAARFVMERVPPEAAYDFDNNSGGWKRPFGNGGPRFLFG